MGYPYLSYPSARLSLLVVHLGLDGVGFSLSSWCWSFVLLIFAISLYTLAIRTLYSEEMFTGCSCTASIFSIYYCCDANALLSCSISLTASSLSPTETVVWCLMLASSLVNNILKLIQFLALVGLSLQVSHSRFKNTVYSMARYAERRMFFSVNGSSPDLMNIFQSSMRVNSYAMGVFGSQCASNAISLYCSCLGRKFP